MQRGRGGRKPPAGSNKRKDGGRLWAPAWPARASSAPMENAGMAPRRGRTKGLRGRPEREPIQLMTGGKTGSRSLEIGCIIRILQQKAPKCLGNIVPDS